VAGWVGGFKSDNKAKLSQLELELGLSLAISCFWTRPGNPHLALLWLPP
jgi:hypothetical protein